jgi:hypothetical protein
LSRSATAPARPRLGLEPLRLGRDEDDHRLRVLAGHDPGRLEAVEARHVDVEQDEVGLQVG